MNLSELKFSVQTKELLDAKTAIDNLGTSIGNLNRVTNEEAKSAVNSEKVKQQQAKTAEASAKAILAEIRAKEAEEKATKSSTESTKTNISVLERQQAILNFMTQGYSKGQASVLAYAQANNAAASDIDQLGKVLEVQRKLMGSSPFDKSMSGLVALKNQYGEVREAIRQYNAESDLTANQTRDLARDKERIIEKLKQEGAGLSQIKQAIREYNTAYVEQANKVNALSKVEKDRERSMRETANASRNVQAAEERLFSTVSHLNDVQGLGVKVNERAALAIGSYERNLRLAGITGEAAAKKLQAFKSAQEQISAAEAKNRAAYVSRGVGVQLGDVGVSLASGMNPLVVAIQQGDQLRGLIQQSGLEAAQMAGIMKQAFGGIITSFKDVGVAMGSFVLGGLQTMGKSVVDVAAKYSGLSAVTNAYIQRQLEAGPPTRSLVTQMQLLGVANKVASIATGSLIAMLVTLAVSTIAAIKEQYKLNQVLNLQGITLGLTTDAVYAQARAMQELGIRQTDTISVISEMAKVGGLSRDSIERITVAAVKLRDYGGVAVEETVKNFSDLAKDPVQASEKLNEKYSYLTSSIYLQIKALQEQGKETEAAKLAQETYADMIENRTKTMTDNLGILEKGWKGISSAAKSAWDSMLNLGRPDPEEEIRKAQATLQGKNYFQGGLAFGGEAEARSIIAAHNAKQEAAKKEADEQLKLAKATKGTIELDKLASEFADKRVKKQVELNKAHLAYSAALAGAAGNTKLQMELAAKYERTLSGIEDKFKDKKKKSDTSVRDKTQSFYLQSLEKINDLNIKNTVSTINLTKAEQLRQDLITSFKWDSKLGKQINLWDQLTQAERNNINAKIDQAKAIELSNIALKQQKEYQQEVLKISEEYTARNTKAVEDITAKNALIGLTEKERLVVEGMIKVEQERRMEIQKIQALTAKRIADGMSVFDALANEKSALNDLNTSYDGYAQKTRTAIENTHEQQTSFVTGWDNAYASYIDSTRNAANLAQNLFQKLTDGMADAIVEFATTGKLSFSDFARSIIADMLRIQAKAIATQLLGNSKGWLGAAFKAFGLFSGAGVDSSFTSGLGSAASMSNSAGFDWTFSKNGNAFTNSGLVSKFADGGAFTNSIVSKPTPFQFGSGNLGLMGEAGPEAILPLQRNSSGQLGVVASAATQAPAPAPQIQQNTKIINVLDPAIVGSYLSTDEGERLIVNVMQKNQSVFNN